LIAGGAGAAVLAALGYRAWDRGVFSGASGNAYRPWDEWRGIPTDGDRQPLRAAILAANPHDTQPWIFEVHNQAITVYADRSRNLGTFDPYRREMHLGLGAAIENLVRAAGVLGYAAYVRPVGGRLALSPDVEAVPAAHITLDSANAASDPLYQEIPNRHTNRGAYTARPIAPETLIRFADFIAGPLVRPVFLVGADARRQMGSLIVKATEAIIADPQMSADSARWFRTGAREVLQHRDGITMDTAGLSPFMVSASKFIPDQSAATADQYWLSMTRDTQTATAPVFGMILVRNRLDMASAIAAGRAWQRLHLLATRQGIAAQPMNQPVEMVDRNAMLNKRDDFGPALSRLANAPGWEATFTFRMGYAERPAAPSPRRPLEDVIVMRG
jgi:nitroreductase